MNPKAFAYATAFTTWLIVFMTIYSEQSAPFKTFLATLAGHHWTAKSLIAVAAFIVISFFLRKIDLARGMVASVVAAVLSVILGSALIFAFFVWHFVSA